MPYADTKNRIAFPVNIGNKKGFVASASTGDQPLESSNKANTGVDKTVYATDNQLDARTSFNENAAMSR